MVRVWRGESKKEIVKKTYEVFLVMIFARCANIIMRACELRRLRMGMVRVGEGRSRVMMCVDVVCVM